jgi:hypothetical protein
MGREYVQVVAAANLSALSGTALRIFARMALVVRDYDDMDNGEPEGIYYGGWKGLTAVLGHGIYERNEPLPPAVKKQIQRGIKELRDAGYVEDVPRAIQKEHTGKVYRLNIRKIPIL